MVEQSEPAAGPLMGRRVGEPADPASRGKEQCGAALRGRPCGISRIRSGLLFDPRMGGGVEPIMLPRDVA